MNYGIRFISLVAVISAPLALPLNGAAENLSREVVTASHGADDSPAAATIRALEQRVEDATVSADTAFLEKIFADDFTYARTTGEIENKAQWLQHVAKRPFLARKIVALEIDIHGDVAVLHGQLDLTVQDERGGHSNLVKYLRVYQQRNGQWQMLTHRSLEETAKPVT